MEDLARFVGERVRAARRDRGMSISALAAAARIGKGSLSELEHGSRNPTLGTLYALAGALGVPLATLIAYRQGATITSPGVEARLLSVSHDGERTVEVYLLRIDGGVRYRSPAHGPGVVEHMLVTSGRVRAGRLGEEAEIGVGEAAQWVSDVPHGYAALGDAAAESVLVIRSPGPALAGPHQIAGSVPGTPIPAAP